MNTRTRWGILSLLGDTMHNFIDGLIIAASFLVSVRVGISTTLAVIFHEIPQEIGDFAVLLHSGYSRSTAIFFNLISACAALLGAVLLLSSAGWFEGLRAISSPLRPATSST